MPHQNRFVEFLRHYGPIPASDNMYDELIQAEIARSEVHPPIQIPPSRLAKLVANFHSDTPTNVILTGTAGDGKTYHCRRLWQDLGGDVAEWEIGRKVCSIELPVSRRRLELVKDLSELTVADKDAFFPGFSAAVAGTLNDPVYLVAANDGQLVASWREWADVHDAETRHIFNAIEGMLVENRTHHSELNVQLYNLSLVDASQHFESIVTELVEHVQWERCNGCELFSPDGITSCPIRINRERLRGRPHNRIFRERLASLLRLASTNRLHSPIRDLLLLVTNIILGDQHVGQSLLTCRTAHNRAKSGEYSLTNPYTNVFGDNLPEKERDKYQVFSIIGTFGIGHETDNRLDNLLIYDRYAGSDEYKALVSNDPYYGAVCYQALLDDYLQGERTQTGTFLQALEAQRRRLFFSLSDTSSFDAWTLTVFRSARIFMNFVSELDVGNDVASLTDDLVRGLNRTFCGMMIDHGAQVYLSSSGGDGRGRISPILEQQVRVGPHRRDIYFSFELADDRITPVIVVRDPALPVNEQVIDRFSLQITHFEYLLRVASGILPASFSRQCFEDFLDFKLRLIERIGDLIGQSESGQNLSLDTITVDGQGRIQVDDIRISLDP